MNGGTISGNKISAVLNYHGSFTLCGGAITDKFRLYGSVIIIGSKLDESSCYKVEMDVPGVFTSGLNGKGTAANFDSAKEDGYVKLNDDGEDILIEDGNSAGYIERSWPDGKVKSEKKAKLSYPCVSPIISLLYR